MGLEDFHPHDLRHTSAAWMVQDGVPIRTVAEYLRHADIRMTMRYAHLSPANVRAAAKVLEGDVSRSSFTLPGAETEKEVTTRQQPVDLMGPKWSG